MTWVAKTSPPPLEERKPGEERCRPPTPSFPWEKEGSPVCKPCPEGGLPLSRAKGRPHFSMTPGRPKAPPRKPQLLLTRAAKEAESTPGEAPPQLQGSLGLSDLGPHPRGPPPNPRTPGAGSPGLPQLGPPTRPRPHGRDQRPTLGRRAQGRPSAPPRRPAPAPWPGEDPRPLPAPGAEELRQGPARKPARRASEGQVVPEDPPPGPRQTPGRAGPEAPPPGGRAAHSPYGRGRRAGTTRGAPQQRLGPGSAQAPAPAPPPPPSRPPCCRPALVRLSSASAPARPRDCPRPARSLALLPAWLRLAPRASVSATARAQGGRESEGRLKPAVGPGAAAAPSPPRAAPRARSRAWLPLPQTLFGPP
ncbi:proline-rich protein HaeIII subfamily 1-like [Dromiciops gliroides]|uniref:proline-rich protein HaeIII subfamily 1-like n=1 Tax=Dromiciops gliroides TaxID=33562 RepID=UPI001CC4F7F1|nr:proline-rich protein HaeIII subfamily 1-like [Dromiciops gliroides]